MLKVIGIPSNGPELSDEISEHFGHCLYFVGIKLNEDNNYEKAFSLPNNGHSSCMEPVMNMKDREVTDMIIGGIGGRPFTGFIQMGINLYQGIQGKTLEENVNFLLEGRLKPLGGPSCSEGLNHNHSN
jgi:predicted Fe-Mo cluster-binding NifX family protein